MANIRKFEDMEAWQGARALVRAIYRATQCGAFSHDFGLRDQIQRAAVSIMSNIAEGFERGSDRDFCRFLSIAKASAGEVRSLLYVALDLAYLDEPSHEHLAEQATSLSRQLGGLIKYLSKPAG
jgi:four helix bundle protein